MLVTSLAPSAKAGATVKAKALYKDKALVNNAREERMANGEGDFTQSAPFWLASGSLSMELGEPVAYRGLPYNSQ